MELTSLIRQFPRFFLGVVLLLSAAIFMGTSRTQDAQWLVIWLFLFCGGIFFMAWHFQVQALKEDTDPQLRAVLLWAFMCLLLLNVILLGIIVFTRAFG